MDRQIKKLIEEIKCNTKKLFDSPKSKAGKQQKHKQNGLVNNQEQDVSIKLSHINNCVKCKQIKSII